MNPPLVVFPGALGVADGGGEALALLARERRIILFEYGMERHAAPFFDRALSAVNAERFDILGFSIGGWFAQCLAARAPAQVRKLVLAHSFTLYPKHRWRFGLARFIWSLIPAALFRAAVTKRARAALAPLRAKRPLVFDQAIRAVAVALAEPDALAKLGAQQDVVRDTLVEPIQPILEILIIDGGDDPMVSPVERGRLMQKYPNAKCVTFRGGGHASALADPHAFATAVDEFLRGHA